jgi:hypothetical protein
MGPVEAAWRRSSEFAFANQIALAIMNPGKYLGLYIDNDSYVYEKLLMNLSIRARTEELN